MNVGISFLSDAKVMWVLLGFGVVFIMIGAVTHAVRHHKQKEEDRYQQHIHSFVISFLSLFFFI